MILEEETYKKVGHYPCDLKSQSHKMILAACDGCGKIRETSKNAYRTLCLSCSMKGRRLSEAACTKISESRKGKNHPMFNKHHTEETRKKMSQSQKGHQVSEETLKWMRESRKGGNAPMFGKHHTEETKQKISEANKGKLAGENSPHWKGGISFEPYCAKFNNTFKEYIRSKFGNVCFLCGKTEEENGARLSVHHVNYDKNCGCAETEEDRIEDNRVCQFVPLCISCNSKVNKDRDKWEKYFKNKLRNKLNGWFI